VKKPTLVLALALLLGTTLSGCGTVCNLAGGVLHPDREPRVFGGFLRDVETISEMANCNTPLFSQPTTKNGGMGAAVVFAAILTVVAVDPMISLAADVLTLPVTIPLQNARQASEREAHDSAPVEATPVEPTPVTMPPSVDAPSADLPPVFLVPPSMLQQVTPWAPFHQTETPGRREGVIDLTNPPILAPRRPDSASLTS
jgi:hypothetical protein